ncbi:MAG: hypothetical protein JNL73_08355 [Anaerolineales bacterium]|nr:hypothetical protein [Anaerolineales bacterium]
MDPSSQLDALTEINLDDLFAALGWPWGRRVLAPLFRPAARAFAQQVAGFDRMVGEQGLSAGAAWLTARFARTLSIAQVAPLPPDAPLLFLANHPGMADTTALFTAIGRAIGRTDLRVVATERPFLTELRHVRQQVLFLTDDPARRLAAVRAVIAELRAGRPVLTFPAGAIEPDPDVAPGAIESLQRWSESAVLFARRTPGAVVVPTLVRGVVAPGAQNHLLTRLRRSPRGRERMAATIQILWPGYRGVHVRVALGRPIVAAETPDLHAAVLAEMTRLITEPPTDFELVLRGVA